MSEIKKIHILGDSVIRGVINETGRFSYRKDSKYGWLSDMGYEVKNNSHIGATVYKGVSIMEKVIDSLDENTLVIFGYGGNDADFNWDKVAETPEDPNLDANVPMEMFLTLYKKLITDARSKGCKVAIFNMAPIDAEKYHRTICHNRNAEVITKWLGDVNMLFRWHEYYDFTLEKMAREMEVPIIDIRTPFLTQHNFKDLYGLDGIHPTEAGYAIIDAAFKAQISNILE
ncbi:MAG: SGNH/GDSL hydrolase family protein [Lachnospiraceae bacterium]|nr:SGNH/GDSL hydrolase family protein [Lachnospiraceae bacterium]